MIDGHLSICSKTVYRSWGLWGIMHARIALHLYRRGIWIWSTEGR